MATRNTNTSAAEVTSFDLEQWLGGASRPEREVTLFADNRVQAEIAALFEERQQLIDQHEPEPREDSWGGGAADAGPDLSDVDKRIKAAQKRLAATGQTFRVRAIDPDVNDAILARHPVKKGASDADRDAAFRAQFYERMADQIIEPRTFTVDELSRLRAAVGEAEFGKLVTASVEVNSDVSASSPFWRGNSGSRPI